SVSTPQHRSGLSASLRERLKRTQRSIISPLSVANCLCVDNGEEYEDSKQVSADSSEIHGEDANRTKTRLGSEGQSTPSQPTQISSEDLAQVSLTLCAQAALYELQSELPIEGRKAEPSELIDLFGLDDSILRFDRVEGDFTT
uniref:Uncharacterized protein n=1 Tax=Cyprinodon variegatus TaxID=28743 RepID=A0A3Q2DYD7_CYPVA